MQGNSYNFIYPFIGNQANVHVKSPHLQINAFFFYLREIASLTIPVHTIVKEIFCNGVMTKLVLLLKG